MLRPRFLLILLISGLFIVALAGSPTRDQFIAQTKQLEKLIPGYSGSYYDRKNNEIVIRIAPHLNPELSKKFVKQTSELPLGSRLPLPRALAQEYERIFRNIRLGGYNKNIPIRFELGKYTWSQHLKWRKQILRFRNNKRSMASYGYSTWPEDCTIYYAGIRSTIKDVTYILIHETCDDAFIKSLFQAIEQQLEIPRDALEIWRVPNWTAMPLDKKP